MWSAISSKNILRYLSGFTKVSLPYNKKKFTPDRCLNNPSLCMEYYGCVPKYILGMTLVSPTFHSIQQNVKN